MYKEACWCNNRLYEKNALPMPCVKCRKNPVKKIELRINSVLQIYMPHPPLMIINPHLPSLKKSEKQMKETKCNYDRIISL